MQYETPRLLECAAESASASCCTPAFRIITDKVWILGTCGTPVPPIP